MRLVLRTFFITVLLAGILTLYMGGRPDLIFEMHEVMQGNHGTFAQHDHSPGNDMPAAETAVVATVAEFPAAIAARSSSAALARAGRPASSGSNTHSVHGSGLNCIETPTSSPVAEPQLAVYRWVDEEGRTHFGDRPPENSNATQIDADRKQQVDYFTLDIDYGGGSQVPFLHDRLRVSANQIFNVLADMIGQERLRTVELNMTVLPDRSAFLDYGGQYLDANVDAYYSSLTNESVTWQHDDPDYTLMVARHESVHVILAGLIGGGVIPDWLNEGLAEYFELMEPRAQYNHVPIDWMSVRITQVNGSRSLQDFMETDAVAWRRNLSYNYPLAASLVYYLMDSAQGRNVLGGLLQEMADNYCQRTGVTDYLEEQYPGGVTALEKNFYAWLDQADASLYHRH